MYHNSTCKKHKASLVTTHMKYEYMKHTCSQWSASVVGSFFTHIDGTYWVLQATDCQRDVGLMRLCMGQTVNSRNRSNRLLSPLWDSLVYYSNHKMGVDGSNNAGDTRWCIRKWQKVYFWWNACKMLHKVMCYLVRYIARHESVIVLHWHLC